MEKWKSSSEKARLGNLLTLVGGIVAALTSFGSWTRVVTIIAALVLLLGLWFQWRAVKQKAEERGELSAKLADANERAAEEVNVVLRMLARRLDLGSRENLWRISLYEKKDKSWDRISRICPDQVFGGNGRESFLAEHSFLRGELGGADSPEGRTYESPVFPDPNSDRERWEQVQTALGIPKKVVESLRFPAQRYYARICWVDGPNSTGRMLALIIECTVPDALTKKSFEDMAPTSWFDSIASSLTNQERIMELQRELGENK